MASKPSLPSRSPGFTYVELLSALVLTAMLLVALNRTVGNVLEANETSRARHESLEVSRYALERMVRAASGARHLLIPLAENPATAYSESVRDPGVLALTLDHTRDLDGNGVPDADNDGDGRFNEDTNRDITEGFAAGVFGLDDNNDGNTDSSDDDDDDEDGSQDEDPIDGIDNDGDGAVDEDPAGDMNGDARPGIRDFDDDGDGSIDEGATPDDDEDGLINEDWWEVVAFYQTGTTLVERIPVPWDETGIGGITGRDFVTRVLTDNVVTFQVERIPAPNGGALVVLSLTTTDATGVANTLETTVRVGGPL